MANFDNHSTRQIVAEQEQRRTEGEMAGYDANPNELPAWWRKKGLHLLTPYERGYFLGRELRIQEDDERKEAAARGDNVETWRAFYAELEAARVAREGQQ